jgi:purine nucleoside phosphorylase
MVNSITDVKIAVIGGSGLYHLEGLEVIEEVYPETVTYYLRSYISPYVSKLTIILRSLGDFLVIRLWFP